MGLKSTTERYGAMVVSMHWLSALLIIVLIASGFRAANTIDAAAKAAILRVHVSIAVAVLALTVLRISWWWGFDRKPDPIARSPHWQERTAQAVHLLFYVVILGMIASGIGMMALSGAAPMIWRCCKTSACASDYRVRAAGCWRDSCAMFVPHLR